jgi:hypothetical protein
MRGRIQGGRRGWRDRRRRRLRIAAPVDRRGRAGDLAAQRSSIFLLDEEADELVFEAVAGEDEQGLVGTGSPRAPASPAGRSSRGSRS